jgi:diaminopimelate epimerase
VARLARDLKLADPDMCFGTAAGPMRAEILPGGVRIHMPPPHDLRRGIRLPEYDGEIAFINTGVPHAVIFTTGLAGADILPAARLLRHHPFFSPGGVNVNFVESRPDRPGLFVRTFERGVEGETLACGTGITASALLAALQSNLESPVQALCRHGETLDVNFERQPDDTFSHVTLTGPAEYVFNGSARYP